MPVNEIRFSDLPRVFTKKVNALNKLSDDEREQIISTLSETAWNKSRAADKLNWSRMTLYRKMMKYNIVKS